MFAPSSVTDPADRRFFTRCALGALAVYAAASVVPLLNSLPQSWDGFRMAWAPRLTGATGGWWAAFAISFCLPDWIPDRKIRREALLWNYFTFFLPYEHARNSPAGVAGSLFAIALAMIVRAMQRRPGGKGPALLDPRHATVAGLLLGLAFVARSETIFLTAGLTAWLLRFGGRIPAAWVGLVAGALASTMLVARGPLFAFTYCAEDLTRVVALGPVLLCALGTSWLLKTRLSLTWITVPYFIATRALGCRGYAALMPIAVYAPTQAALAWLALPQKYPRAGRAVACFTATATARRLYRAAFWINMALLATGGFLGLVR